jgi:hypothetical protein
MGDWCYLPTLDGRDDSYGALRKQSTRFSSQSNAKALPQAFLKITILKGAQAIRSTKRAIFRTLP